MDGGPDHWVVLRWVGMLVYVGFTCVVGCMRYIARGREKERGGWGGPTHSGVLALLSADVVYVSRLIFVRSSIFSRLPFINGEHSAPMSAQRKYTTCRADVRPRSNRTRRKMGWKVCSLHNRICSINTSDDALGPHSHGNKLVKSGQHIKNQPTYVPSPAHSSLPRP